MARFPFKMLSAPVPPIPIGKENSILLLLDPQRFASDQDVGLGLEANQRGILHELDEYYRQVGPALSNMARLIAACRRNDIAIVYSILNSQRADRSDLSRQLRATGLPVPIGEPGLDICRDVAPAPGEAVLPRGTYSPFAGPSLLARLRHNGVQTIVVAGLMANITVATAAREAADRDLGVVVVWDASASETLEQHRHIKDSLVGGLVCVRYTREVIEMLSGAAI
jgi:nicotinamidase-related amidase